MAISGGVGGASVLVYTALALMTTFALLPFVKASENLTLKGNVPGGDPLRLLKGTIEKHEGAKRTKADSFRINTHIQSCSTRSLRQG